MNDIEVIREYLDQPEILAQLAEEAAELSWAALKLRRAYMDENPTPVSAREAYEALLEEVADVQVCITAAGFDGPLQRRAVENHMTIKMSRWATRLTEKEAGK